MSYEYIVHFVYKLISSEIKGLVIFIYLTDLLLVHKAHAGIKRMTIHIWVKGRYNLLYTKGRAEGKLSVSIMY